MRGSRRENAERVQDQKPMARRDKFVVFKLACKMNLSEIPVLCIGTNSSESCSYSIHVPEGRMNLSQDLEVVNSNVDELPSNQKNNEREKKPCQIQYQRYSTPITQFLSSQQLVS